MTNAVECEKGFHVQFLSVFTQKHKKYEGEPVEAQFAVQDRSRLLSSKSDAPSTTSLYYTELTWIKQKVRTDIEEILFWYTFYDIFRRFRWSYGF